MKGPCACCFAYMTLFVSGPAEPSFAPSCFGALGIRRLGKLLELDALAIPQALPCTRYARQKTRVALELVVEPIILRSEANEDACRLTVLGNDNLFVAASRRYFGKSSLIFERVICFIAFTIRHFFDTFALPNI